MMPVEVFFAPSGKYRLSVSFFSSSRRHAYTHGVDSLAGAQ